MIRADEVCELLLLVIVLASKGRLLLLAVECDSFFFLFPFSESSVCGRSWEMSCRLRLDVRCEEGTSEFEVEMGRSLPLELRSEHFFLQGGSSSGCVFPCRSSEMLCSGRLQGGVRDRLCMLVMVILLSEEQRVEVEGGRVTRVSGCIELLMLEE